jgi:hypothetical protein
MSIEAGRTSGERRWGRPLVSFVGFGRMSARFARAFAVFRAADLRLVAARLPAAFFLPVDAFFFALRLVARFAPLFPAILAPLRVAFFRGVFLAADFLRVFFALGFLVMAVTLISRGWARVVRRVAFDRCRAAGRGRVLSSWLHLKIPASG